MTTTAASLYSQEPDESQPAAKTCLLHRGRSTTHSGPSAINPGCAPPLPDLQWELHSTVPQNPWITFSLAWAKTKKEFKKNHPPNSRNLISFCSSMISERRITSLLLLGVINWAEKYNSTSPSAIPNYLFLLWEFDLLCAEDCSFPTGCIFSTCPPAEPPEGYFEGGQREHCGPDLSSLSRIPKTAAMFFTADFRLCFIKPIQVF